MSYTPTVTPRPEINIFTGIRRVTGNGNRTVNFPRIIIEIFSVLGKNRINVPRDRLCYYEIPGMSGRFSGAMSC